MAGRPPEVAGVKTSFIAQLDSASALVTAINALPRAVNSTHNTGIHPKYVEQAIELAFMGVVAAWEEFLERALVRYVAGAQALTGYHPTPKFGLAKNIQHSYEIISQNSSYDSTKNFLKVTDAKWVAKTADFFFSTHSFSCLTSGSNITLLSHANSIRNRVAHSSDKCKKDFKDTAIYFMQPASNKLTKGYKPASLLQVPALRHFNTSSISAGHTHFNAYIALYKRLASQIVP